ncbi:unnamed protein product [Cochlearia groenlandica]
MFLCTEGSCVNKSKESVHHKKSILIPVVASIASVVVIASPLVLFFVLKRKNKEKGRGSRSPGPPRITKKKKFTYAEIIEMTNNFEKIIGKGGFGMVYHGYVNGTEQDVVKVVSQDSTQGHKQFKAEVDLLLRVHHKNLVNLVGYCEKGNDLALVYEYMANGDLKEILSGKRNWKRDSFYLRWGTRLKIAVEAAQGLEYLNKGCTPPIVHRDVKTANILLDENFQAKMADFGLSRSFTNEGETHVSLVVAGTIGYLDQDFGIVLLEIITNLRVIDQTRETPYIAEWVGSMVTKGDIRNITDPSLNGDYHIDSVWKVFELAMTCVDVSPASRPTTSQVVIEVIECLRFENSRGETSGRNGMEINGSRDVTMSFGTKVNPLAR